MNKELGCLAWVVDGSVFFPGLFLRGRADQSFCPSGEDVLTGKLPVKYKDMELTGSLGTCTSAGIKILS